MVLLQTMDFLFKYSNYITTSKVETAEIDTRIYYFFLLDRMYRYKLIHVSFPNKNCKSIFFDTAEKRLYRPYRDQVTKTEPSPLTYLIVLNLINSVMAFTPYRFSFSNRKKELFACITVK